MEYIAKLRLFIWRNKFLILFLILSIFLRFYELGVKSHFGWDEVNNAWAAHNIIVNHEFPLLGFQAKMNSGIYIGPYYYYLIAVVYFLTDLNPIASGIMAGITSIFTFLILFYISKKLVSINVAFIAIFLNTVSFFGINFDRIQGPINFIPSMALVIFFALYKIITGNPKFIILLAFAFGFLLHIHVTAIYFPIIIFFCLPFFPRNKETVRYIFLSIPILLFFFFPSIIAFLQNLQHASNAISYGNTYFHGFHLRRVVQLANDSLIQFEPYFNYSNTIRYVKFILIPIFMLVYLYRNIAREKLLFCYLVLLWFAIPLIILSTYSGEISDYYYVSNRFIALLIIAYLISKAVQSRFLLIKATTISLLIVYMLFNLQRFFQSTVTDNLNDRKNSVLEIIKKGGKVEFYEGVPESYIYYYYMRKRGIEVY